MAEMIANIVPSRMWGYVDFGRGGMTGNVSPARLLRDLISWHHVKSLDVKALHRYPGGLISVFAYYKGVISERPLKSKGASLNINEKVIKL